MIRITITDDMPIVLEGLKLLLQRIPDFEIVAEYSNGKELLDHISESTADVYLTDIEMPVMDGITATREILSTDPCKKVIALSMYSDSENYYDMIRSGAKGFVPKQSSINELEQAVRTVFSGGNYFSTDLLHNVIVNLPDSDDAHNKKNNHNPGLTDKELSLLKLICHGHSNKELAEKLFISIKTVESQKTRLMEKTGTRNASGLIIWAIKNKIVNF
jgi:DNA-binding NarL/FixJ family response regulator